MIIPGWLLTGLYVTAFLLITGIEVTTAQHWLLVIGSMFVSGMYIVVPIGKLAPPDETKGEGDN